MTTAGASRGLSRAYSGHRERPDRFIVNAPIGAKVIGAKRRWVIGQLSSLASFLREGPFSTIRWALCRRRSQMASARVAFIAYKPGDPGSEILTAYFLDRRT